MNRKKKKDLHVACRWGIRPQLGTDTFQLMMKQSPRSEYYFVLSVKSVDGQASFNVHTNQAWEELQTKPAQKSYRFAAFPVL